MTKFTIVFKSGAKVVMTAEHVSATRSTVTGGLTEFKYSGATDNVPLYLNLSEVAGVLQNHIPEKEEEDHGNV